MMAFLRRTVFGLFFLTAAFGGSAWAKPLQPALMLLKADYLLTPKGSYEYEGEITVEAPGEEADTLKFSAAVQELNRRRITLESPKSEKGKSLLADGDELWLYLPKLERSVRVPPETSFAGAMANADLALPFFSLRYQAVFAKEESFEGRPAWVLTLLPRSRNSIYAKLKLWLDREDRHPLQVEYYDKTGGVLIKSCRFEDYREELGTARPLRWVFQGADPAEGRTVLRMKNFERRNFDAGRFLSTAGPELFLPPEKKSEAAFSRKRSRGSSRDSRP